MSKSREHALLLMENADEGLSMLGRPSRMSLAAAASR
jgi:hypothetical protein